jgi:hypothetical protein
MRLIARTLGVMFIALSASALCAGATSPTPQESASFDGAGKMTNQMPNGWISSTAYNQTDGTLTIDFHKGLFSTAPNCAVSTHGPVASVKQSPELLADAFPQVVAAYPDRIVVLDSITPKGKDSLSAFQLVCGGTP